MNRKRLLALGLIVAAAAGSTLLWRGSAKPGQVMTGRIEGNRWRVARADRDRYLADAAALERDVVLRPVPMKDLVEHLRVEELASASPLAVAGFRKGDLILKVNGAPINTMERAVNLVHELRQAAEFDVRVQRGDAILDFRFEFR